MKVSESKDLIYLDNAATSWPKPDCVSAAVSEIIKYGCANPGRSGHRMSIDTARTVYSARESAAALIGADDPLEIIFSPNATFALNMAINGLITPEDHVITTGMEHNSVMRPLKALESLGTAVTVAACGSDGIIDPSEIQKSVRKNTKAIIVTHASNVTGTIMPVDDITRIARSNGIITIVDGAQTAGSIPVNVKKSNIDIFAFTGHKSMLGPQGTGGLYISKGVDKSIKAVFSGGTGSKSEKEEQPDFMPDKFEPGTANSPGIAGLGAAIDFILKTGLKYIIKKERLLTEKFLNGLLSLKGVTVYGPCNTDLQTAIVSLNIINKSSSEVSQRLDDEFGILTRPGLQCAPAAHRTIGTFSSGTVRLSIGYFNSEEDIERTLNAIDIIASGN